MAALVYVLKTFFKTPIHLPGHTAILWVIPFIIAIGITKKFGSGIYVGVLSGLLLSTIGTSDTGILTIFEYTAMGITMDFLALTFKGHIDNILVGLILGAFGSFVKEVVHFYVASALSGTLNYFFIGVGTRGITALVFGAAGGVISAIIINRVKHLQFPNRKGGKKKSDTAEKQKKGELA
jgi:hypothetical protein